MLDPDSLEVGFAKHRSPRKYFMTVEAGTTGLQMRERLSQRRDVELLSIDQARAPRKEALAKRDILAKADLAMSCPTMQRERASP